jgi:hypothetical protein
VTNSAVDNASLTSWTRRDRFAQQSHCAFSVRAPVQTHDRQHDFGREVCECGDRLWSLPTVMLRQHARGRGARPALPPPRSGFGCRTSSRAVPRPFETRSRAPPRQPVGEAKAGNAERRELIDGRQGAACACTLLDFGHDRLHRPRRRPRRTRHCEVGIRVASEVRRYGSALRLRRRLSGSG